MGNNGFQAILNAAPSLAESGTEPKPSLAADERRRKLVECILRITKGQRKLLNIVEIEGDELSGFASMGHFCYAQIKDPERALEAQRRWHWLKVSTEPIVVEPDIMIDGDRIEAVRLLPTLV